MAAASLVELTTPQADPGIKLLAGGASQIICSVTQPLKLSFTWGYEHRAGVCGDERNQPFDR